MALEFYAVGTNLAALQALTGTNLVTEPYPTEYHEGENAATSGTSRPVVVGFPWAIWKWDTPITAECLKTFTDLLGANQYASVYIRTRTNNPEADGTYEYLYFSAEMWRPKVEPKPGYRYENVEIEFRRLVEQP